MHYPTILCCGIHALFTKNEFITKYDISVPFSKLQEHNYLGTKACLHINYGDVVVKLLLYQVVSTFVSIHVKV